MDIIDKLNELVTELKDYKHNRAAEGDLENVPLNELYPRGFEDGVDFVVRELEYLLDTTPSGITETEQLRKILDQLNND